LCKAALKQFVQVVLHSIANVKKKKKYLILVRIHATFLCELFLRAARVTSVSRTAGLNQV